MKNEKRNVSTHEKQKQNLLKYFREFGSYFCDEDQKEAGPKPAAPT